MLVQSSSKEDFQAQSPPQHAFVYVPLPLASMKNTMYIQCPIVRIHGWLCFVPLSIEIKRNKLQVPTMSVTPAFFFICLSL